MLLVSKLLSFPVSNQRFLLVNGVVTKNIVTARESISVAVLVLDTRHVTGSVASPFEHDQESFNVIGICHAMVVLADRVVDCFMLAFDVSEGLVVDIDDCMLIGFIGTKPFNVLTLVSFTTGVFH